MKLGRLVRTVAPLRPVQIYGRLWFRVHRPKRVTRPAPPARPRVGSWVPPAPKAASILSETRATFLNREGDIVWNDATQEKLWLYNLHYFDGLGAFGQSQLQRDLLDRWVVENPVGAGNGWEPYPISLRIVNWIKWWLAGHDLGPTALASLADQTRFLTQRLEHHLLGNHLLANAKALVFAGAAFDGPEADRWFRQGSAILAREVAEQVLADGGHFERSPMYHAIMLEDFLDLENLRRAYGRAPVAWPIGPMRRWLQAMTHPDGGPAFFNDTALGVAPTFDELEAYALRLGHPLLETVEARPIQLAQSGYMRAVRGDATLLIDAAPIGPDYLPGHAHADTLSFELSIGGERIIVNSGTSTYQPGPQREAERATRAHSTIEIEGLDSSEVWGSFRVGRRARVSGAQIADTGQAVVASASHDGYTWLAGAPRHERAWRLEDRRLVVTDTIHGRASSATARFHLPAGIVARDGRLTTPGGRKIGYSPFLRVAPSEWRPRFGVREPSFCLVAELGERLQTEFNW